MSVAAAAFVIPIVKQLAALLCSAPFYRQLLRRCARRRRRLANGPRLFLARKRSLARSELYTTHCKMTALLPG